MIKKITFITLLISFTLTSNAQRKHHLSEFITKHNMSGLVKSEKLIGYEGEKTKTYPKPSFVADSSITSIAYDDFGDEITVNGYYEVDSTKFTYNTLSMFEKFSMTQTWDREKRLITENRYTDWRDVDYYEPYGSYEVNKYSYNTENYLIKKECSYSYKYSSREEIDSNSKTVLIAYDMDFNDLTNWDYADNIYFFKDSLLQMAFSQEYYFDGVSGPNVRIYQYDEQNKLIGIKMQLLNYGNKKPVIDASKYFVDTKFLKEEKEQGDAITPKKEKEVIKENKLDEYGNWVYKKSHTLFGHYWYDHEFTFERTLEYYR